MGFDPDDLRCDLESAIEDLRDNASYMDDRIDDIECYKITEDEARDIAIDVVREEIISERDVNEESTAALLVSLSGPSWSIESRNSRIVSTSRALGARVLRWLREGPSIKEVATGWYASIRRGS